MSSNMRMILAIAVGAIIGLFLLVGIVLLFTFSGFPRANTSWGFRSPMMGPSERPNQSYSSNGERIYFTGTSESGDPIRANRRGMQGMMARGMACADCHGSDGRGGTVRMMMGTYTVPDIRYATLTGEEHEEGEEHPAYTDETIKRAITEGIDPAGEALEWPMPRWEMSESDLNDLLDFLKTLE